MDMVDLVQLMVEVMEELVEHHHPVGLVEELPLDPPEEDGEIVNPVIMLLLQIKIIIPMKVVVVVHKRNMYK